jgi:hypothetical protein
MHRLDCQDDLIYDLSRRVKKLEDDSNQAHQIF